MKNMLHQYWCFFYGLGVLLLSPLATATHPCAPFLLGDHSAIIEQLQTQTEVLKAIGEQGFSRGQAFLPPENLRIWRRLEGPNDAQTNEPLEQIVTLVQQRDHYLGLAAEKILERDICQKRLGPYLSKLKNPSKNISAQGLAKRGREVMQILASLRTPEKTALVPILDRTESLIVEFYLDQIWQKIWASRFMALTKQALAPHLYQGPFGTQYLWEINFTPAEGSILYDFTARPDEKVAFWPPRDRLALQTLLNSQRVLSFSARTPCTYLIGHLNPLYNGIESLNPKQLGLRHHLSSEIFLGKNPEDIYLRYYLLRENRILSSTLRLLNPEKIYVSDDIPAIFWNNHKNGITCYDYGRWKTHLATLEAIAPRPIKFPVLQALEQELGPQFEEGRRPVFREVIKQCASAWQQGTATIKVFQAVPGQNEFNAGMILSLSKTSPAPHAVTPAPAKKTWRRLPKTPPTASEVFSNIVLTHQPIFTPNSLILVEITTAANDGVLLAYPISDPQVDLTSLIGQSLDKILNH